MKIKNSMIKTINCFTVIMVLFILTTLPVAFAVSVNPESIAVEVTDTTATIRWTTDTAATGSINYGKTTSSLTEIPSTAGQATTHQAMAANLDTGENYYYNIKATDSSGTYTTTYMNFTTLLEAPRNLRITKQENNAVTLQWDKVDNSRLYYVFKDKAYFDIASNEEYRIADLGYNTGYAFYVTAVDQYGRQSAQSSEVSALIGDRPVNSTFIQATEITKTQATISWQTDLEANSTVKYGTKRENLNLTITDAGKTTQHKLILKNLEEDKIYYYTVLSASSVYADIFSFKTLGDETPVAFSNVKITDITRSSAEISWTTNIETRGYVYYSTDDSFTQYTREDSDQIIHNEELKNLLSGATYYFKLVAGDTSTAIYNFTTSESLYDFIDMEDVPEVWNSAQLTLKGTTAENGKIYIFVNRASNPYAQVMTDINGTYFEATVTLNPYAYVDGIKGRNNIEIDSWDKDNNKAVRTYIVDVDTVSPLLSVNDFSTWTNAEDLNISGYTDKDTTVTFYIDEKKKASVYVSVSGTENTSEENDGYFEQVINVGTATKSHNVTVEAKDTAGNIAVYTKEIHVDRQDPKLTFFTSFTESTHYKLFRIDGQTEPNAAIKVTNFGEYSGCDDINFQSKYGDCDYLAATYGNGPHQTLDMLLDPTSLMLDLLDLSIGIPTTTVADDEGNFSVIVSLLAGTSSTDWADTSKSTVTDAKLKAAKNTLVFNVTDLAGNKYDTQKQIKYQPSCADWSIAKTTTFPMNIYSQDLTGGDILGSALLELRYIGSGVPKLTKIMVQKDASGGNQLIKEGEAELGTAERVYYAQSYGGLDNSNEYISLSSQDVKHTEYENGKVYLYVPITVGKYKGNIEELPEQFGVYLDAYLSYTDGYGQVSSCHLYPAVAYDVQKPETISKWLSPTMINQTIQLFDQTINVTETAVHYLTVASRWTLVGCGGMIAWNYAKGFSGGSLDENQCNTDMEKVYMVCDRILCPPIGKNCDRFEPVGDLLYGGKSCSASDPTCRQKFESAKDRNEAIQNDQGVQGAYTAYRREYPDASFNDFYQNDKTETHRQAISAAENGGAKYDPTLHQAYTYQVKDPTTGKIVTLEYMNLDEPYNSRMSVDEALKQDVINCGKDTQAVVRVTGITETESSYLDLSGYGEKVHTQEGQEIYCSKTQKEELGKPSNDMIPGCYSEKCPTFDNTKCLFGKGYGINPAEGLFASLQCGCLTGAKGHLENYLKILKGGKKCFEQVLLGDQTAGYCERLMSYFVCDILTELFKHLFKSLQQGVGPLASLYGPENVENYQKNAEAIGSSLNSRYGNIVKNNAAFSADNLINKACIAAFTADWSVLEGVLDTMVENIYVEPIATISGSSRPYGFDPFSGRITMAYNIYVGIFPGGPTKVEAWLSCDKSMPGSEFCAEGDTSKFDLVQTGKLNGYYDEDDYVDENIVVFDNNGMSIYNKATLVLTYEVGGIVKDPDVTTAQIYAKSDIRALGCQFSPVYGFECSLGMEFMDLAHGVGGMVQLFSETQGTKISPDVNEYYGSNQVAALVKIKNAYADDFFIRVKTASNEFEYWALGGTDSGDYYGMQYYLLWLDGSKASGTATISLTDWTDDLRINSLGQTLYFSLPEELESITLRLSPMSAQTAMNAVSCTINKNNASDLESNIGNTNAPNEKFYPCLIGTETYTVQGAGTEKKYAEIDAVSAVTFHDIKVASGKTVNAGQQLQFFLGNANVKSTGDTKITAEYKSASSLSSTSSRSASINVLADMNGDNFGETKIYSPDQDPKDQEVKLAYKISSTASSSVKNKPVIHFIEPEPIIESDTGWVNSDGKPVPIGFTLWDDNNNIDTLSIGIVGWNGYQCLATWTFNETNNKLEEKSSTAKISNKLCGLSITDRFIGFADGKPPFFEFELEVDGDKIVIDSDAYYDITLHAVDGNGNQAQDRIRRIRFSETSSDTRDDMLICLGSGGCTGSWNEPENNVQTIAAGSAQDKQTKESATNPNAEGPKLQALTP